MASHKSAEKRARQTERRTAVNTARRSRVRGSIKKVEEAIKAGDKKAAAGRAARGAAGDPARRDQAHRDQERRRASRVAPRRAHQGDGLSALRSFRDCERRSNERRFLFCELAPKKFRALRTKNVWSPIGRTTYDSRLSDCASERALDVERRRMRSHSERKSNPRRCQSSRARNIMNSVRCSARESFANCRSSLSKSWLIATGRGALRREPRRRWGASSSPTRRTRERATAIRRSATIEQEQRPLNDAHPEFSSPLHRAVCPPSIVGS